MTSPLAEVDIIPTIMITTTLAGVAALAINLMKEEAAALAIRDMREEVAAHLQPSFHPMIVQSGKQYGQNLENLTTKCLHRLPLEYAAFLHRSLHHH